MCLRRLSIPFHRVNPRNASQQVLRHMYVIITQYIFCSLGVIIDLKEHFAAFVTITSDLFALIHRTATTRRTGRRRSE